MRPPTATTTPSLSASKGSSGRSGGPPQQQSGGVVMLGASCSGRTPLPTPCSTRGWRHGRMPAIRRRDTPALCRCSSRGEQQSDRRQLMQALETAVAQEDYAKAAQLKKELEELTARDPRLALQQQLQQAVAEERYQEAARLRDELQLLEEQARPKGPDLTLLQQLPTSSDTLTDGIRVTVQSYYMPSNSMPGQERYFFKYSVKIANEGSRIVMLKSRHWVITNGAGRVDEVRGPGVVGEQPILEPGRSFQYESACPLNTVLGSMEGEYQMVVLDADTGGWGDKFDVKIGLFALNAAGPTAT